MNYPQDAITKTISVASNTTQYFETGNATRTVLGFSIQQQNLSSNTELRCGVETVAINFAKDVGFNATQKICRGDLAVVKTGNDTAQIIITYVNRDVSLTPRIDHSFTSGEVVIVVLLFASYVVLSMLAYHVIFRRVKIKNQ